MHLKDLISLNLRFDCANFSIFQEHYTFMPMCPNFAPVFLETMDV